MILDHYDAGIGFEYSACLPVLTEVLYVACPDSKGHVIVQLIRNFRPW